MATRILIVDDSRTEALRARLLLERAGYQVTIAADGSEGLARAAQDKPDLIFLDTIMPKLNGFEACGKLKLDPKTSKIPVVLLPTAEEIADMPSGPALDCFLTKPYDPNMLVEKVKSIVSDNSKAGSTDDSMRYREELALTRQQLEAANRARRDILANMSHELRTPLHEIIGMTDLLLGTQLTPEQQGYIETSKTSGNALLSLVSDVIEFSELEAGQLGLESKPFELQEPIDRMLEIMQPRAQEKGIGISTTLASGVPKSLNGDANRLRQVLANLIANAIKFTEQGEISVRVDVETQHDREVELHFRVRDTGIGIPEDRRELIFEPFQQVDSSATRRYGGMGMGLATSRQIVKLMGGRIWVESEIGKGSTFHFVVKFGIVAQVVKAAPVAAASLNWPRKLNILVAEDSPTNQLIAKSSLKKEGHTVTLANNGRECVQAYEKSRQVANEPLFDLILMDVAMPEMDGLDATFAIREKEKVMGGHIIIVAMTAFATKEYQEKCIASGMDAYVTKPVRIAELDKTLEPLMNRAQQISKAEVCIAPVDFAAALEVVGDDVDILREAIGFSLTEVPEELRALQLAMDNGEPKGVEAKAHRLKGVMGNIGGLKARDIAQKLETMGEQGNLDGGPDLVKLLVKEITRVINFYQDPSWEQRAREFQAGNHG
ncbi:MAG: response regulator [Chloroflexi bacterium]|nr:response regulator [Chloroflexota bacterium]